MIEAIIFDCFGVVRTDAFEDAYVAMGGDLEKDAAFIKDVFWQSNSGRISSSIPLIAERLGVAEDVWREAVNKGVIHQDVLEYANELRRTYKVAMLSNIGSGGLGRFFEAGFLEQYFDLVVASSDIGFAKPEAGAYEAVANRLGVRLDACVMIDDRQDYIDGATAVGMKTILYQNLQQLKRELAVLL